jgi:hypothetical protein
MNSSLTSASKQSLGLVWLLSFSGKIPQDGSPSPRVVNPGCVAGFMVGGDGSDGRIRYGLAPHPTVIVALTQVFVRERTAYSALAPIILVALTFRQVLVGLCFDCRTWSVVLRPITLVMIIEPST